MSFPIRAITLDLDDTLWPIAPVIVHAEARLDAWLREHAPRTAAQWPVAAMRTLREDIARDHPDLAHDFGAQRRLCLAHALHASGDDPAHADGAFAAFLAARNEVRCYDDAIDALQRLAARLPVAALTNGNADLARIGLAHHFVFNLAAREHGMPKPDAGIFHAACARLGVPPAQVLHVGDDIALDVVGAARAGLRTCWINRADATGQRQEWPADATPPDLHFETLTGLADWLDMHGGVVGPGHAASAASATPPTRATA